MAVESTQPEQSANEVSATASPQLETSWLSFWTYVHLPLGVVLGVPLALSRAGSATNLFGAIVIEAPLVWLVSATAFGLHKRRLWAWRLNWLYLLADIIGLSFTRVGKAAAGEKVTTFAASLVAYSLVWGIPNYIYFKALSIVLWAAAHRRRSSRSLQGDWAFYLAIGRFSRISDESFSPGVLCGRSFSCDDTDCGVLCRSWSSNPRV
jgi:hypothetical protein